MSELSKSLHSLLNKSELFMKIKILYIDDEAMNLTTFKATFRRGFEIFTAESAREGKKIIEEEKDIHIIVTDQKMPEMTGIEFLESIIEKYPDPIRILLTGYSDMNAVVDAINKGRVYQYVEKPWKENEFKIILEKAYEIYSLRKENIKLTESLKDSNKKLEFMIRQKFLD